MIAVEIPAALAERPEVVPVDRCSTCGGDGEWEDLEVGPGAMRACGACVSSLPSLVGQRVALAWRETFGMKDCGSTDPTFCNGEHCDCPFIERMVVGWTAEVEAVVPIVRDPEMMHGDLAIVNHWNELHALVGGRQIVRQVSGDADWSPGRYALVLRELHRDPLHAELGAIACRPFHGFAELSRVLR